MSGEFKPVPVPAGVILLPCPFCGSPAELNEFIDIGATSKLVSCSNGGEFEDDECVMYLPSNAAYKATKREAIAVWNTRAPGMGELSPHPSLGDAKPIDGLV